jgi:hypothetical protein
MSPKNSSQKMNGTVSMTYASSMAETLENLRMTEAGHCFSMSSRSIIKKSPNDLEMNK